MLITENWNFVFWLARILPRPLQHLYNTPRLWQCTDTSSAALGWSCYRKDGKLVLTSTCAVYCRTKSHCWFLANRTWEKMWHWLRETTELLMVTGFCSCPCTVEGTRVQLYTQKFGKYVWEEGFALEISLLVRHTTAPPDERGIKRRLSELETEGKLE